MEITKTQKSEWLELRLSGRLDASWADHVDKTINESIRAGSHQIELNFAKVDYLSSAGIRVLLKYYKELKSVQGRLKITEPGGDVYKVLKVSGLGVMVDSPAVSAPGPAKITARSIEKAETTFQIFDQAPGAKLRCSLIGHPQKFFDGGFQEADCTSVPFPRGTFGLGLGAFGTGFQDCRERFGEFLAIGGTAATLPTDGSSIPDFVVSTEALVPELNVLYAMTGQGEFAQMIRFDCKPQPPAVIGLGTLVDTALEIAGASAAGLVILAEGAGMVGAALRRSPGRSDAQSPLAFPAVRDWVSFTTERTNERNLVLVAGFAMRQPPPQMAPFVRQFAPNSTVQGHFHAALFPYRPVQRGELRLNEAVSGLMATDRAETLLHLLNDGREFEGVGQSEFMRGACWIGPIADFQTRET